MKKGLGLTAQRLRVILSVILVLVLVGSAAGFSYVQHLLQSYVADTNALNKKADLSSTNLQTLRQIKTYLANHASDIALAKRVVADSKSYQYQNDIINDLTDFAQKSGITITQFDFSGDSASGSSSATGTPSTTPTPSPIAVKSSLNSKSVTITIKSPVDYYNLLEFMHYIEQNVTKMQIAEVSLSGDSNGSSNKVSAQTFNIQVYVQ